MKAKITLVILLFVGLNFGFSQQDEECITKLSIFHEYVKAKNYDSAFEPWMTVKNKCPKLSLAIYSDGEKILKHKIEESTGANKEGLINDLIKLWKDRAAYYPAKTPKGKFAAQACQLLYDNKDVMHKSTQELYDCFDAAYKLDKDSFTNPKSLYTYFSLMVDLYDAKAKSAAELFNTYDDIADKIEEEVKNTSSRLNKLIEKEESGTTLASKENRYKLFYEQTLGAYDQISTGIDQKLGERANCGNLIPLYTKDFVVFKTDAVWLKRAVSRMFYKECTDAPLYEKLVKAYDETAPSADTKYFVGTILLKNGKENEAISYFKESFDLEADTFKKSRLANRIGLILKKKGRYAQARGYFRDALKLNPSNGRPHLSIAAMYASSANSCGDTTFNKRAVYWLAAAEAKKAEKADSTLKKSARQSVANYEAKAPSKADIFSAGNSGQTINIGCWIGASVTVPQI